MYITSCWHSVCGTSDQERGVVFLCSLNLLHYFVLHCMSCCLTSAIFQMSGFTQSPLKFTQLRHLTMEVTCGGNPNSVFQLAYLLQAAPLLEDLHFNVSKCFVSLYWCIPFCSYRCLSFHSYRVIVIQLCLILFCLFVGGSLFLKLI